MSDTASLSSIEESQDTKVKFSNLDEDWQSSVKTGLNAAKKQNPNAKKAVIKGQPHQSSTVQEHSSVVSVQIRDNNEKYIGSVHIDQSGTMHPNDKFQKSVGK